MTLYFFVEEEYWKRNIANIVFLQEPLKFFQFYQSGIMTVTHTDPIFPEEVFFKLAPIKKLCPLVCHFPFLGLLVCLTRLTKNKIFHVS